MKKFFLSAFVVVTFIGYALHDRSERFESIVSNTPTPSFTPQTSPQIMNSMMGLKDGEYTGDNTDAYYGNVQVKATIKNGKIADVVFLDYPRDRRTSEEINQQAMPMLTSEAIQAQSAQVDIISGATQTSRAFIQSLQSALSQAKS